MTIPTTCPDFVSHPHIVEVTRRYKDSEGNTIREEKREGACYQCQTSACSEEQGTSAIAEALIALGIPADVHQTGGFTMCVYVKTGEQSYIYANDEGFSFYCDDECEGLHEYDFRDQMTPAEKAQEIAEKMNANSLKALAL